MQDRFEVIPAEGLLERPAVGQVGLDDLLGLDQFRPPRGKIIENDGLVAGLPQELDRVRADVAGPPG
jgi:hypothetical protein